MLPVLRGYWVRRSKYENGVVFVVAYPGISPIIRYLSGGVIDVYGPKVCELHRRGCEKDVKKR